MVIKTAIIYAVVGLFHFVFRKKFMAISFNAEAAHGAGINVRMWDFLFYMSFGFVITSSVVIAGVFLVFSYLVIPSVGAMLVSDKLSTRLALGWIGASIISVVGVKLSWTTGLPTVEQKLKDNDAVVREGAVELLIKLHVKSSVPAILELLDDNSDQVVLAVARAARAMGDSSVASRPIDKSARVDDPELKSSLLKAAIEMGNPDAIPALIDVVNEGGVFGDDAYDIVRGHMEINVGKEQPGKLNEWWKENWNRIQWDADGHIFRLRK